MLKQQIEAELVKHFRIEGWRINTGRDIIACDNSGECDECGEPIDGSEVNLSKLAESLSSGVLRA
jgi:RNA polymerase-binding transcription factor DksA